MAPGARLPRVGGRGPRPQQPLVNSPRPTGRVPKAFTPAGSLGRAVSGDVLNIRGLQHFLRNKGFDVNVDGKLGPVTKQALRDAIDKGILQNPTFGEMHAIRGMHGQVLGPHAFNELVHKGGTAPYLPLVGGKHGPGLLTRNGSVNAGGGGSVGGGGQTVNDKGTMQALKASTGHAIPAADANFGQMFDVNKMAQAMANEQFQPQVNDAQLQVNRDPRQSAQNEADVANWYKQALDAQAKAGQQDQAATQAGVHATDAATQALVQSLGGGANQGSGEVAAAGQNASGTLQALGQAQSNLDSELAPILQAQAAQQRTDQHNIDQTKLENDQQVLRDLQGQRGNAETSAQMQLQSANNSLDQARNQALMGILQYNNSLGQQKFQNELGLTDAQIAAAMNGVGLADKQAQANYYNSRAAYYAHGGGGGGSRSASQLNDIQRQLYAALGSKGMIVSPSSGVYKLAPGVTPAQALQFSRNFVSSYGSLPGGFVPNTLNAIQGY